MNLDSEHDQKPDSGTKKTVKVLWTGGFDSTYRIVELSQFDVLIQPYYLMDKQRRSEKCELNAIREITADIEKHPGTRCRILPLITQQTSDINQDCEIVGAYNRLRNISYIGPQYIWLAEFARSNKGLELCIETDDSHCGATWCLRKNGKLKKIIEGDLVYWILDEANSSRDVMTVFGSLRFPIIEITKLEMLEKYRVMGFSETMKKTWFCHTPVNGEPCGVCSPCRQAIEAGLAFRVPPAGLDRHKKDMHFSHSGWFKYWKKIRYRVYGF
jgi:7-cyano-7-deazaguanine synthase